MFSSRLMAGLAIALGALTLGGCASYYDGYGYGSGVSIGYGTGYGYGYDPYGYYGSRYYGNRYYGDRYYGGYGYRPYYGWYGDYYYPGTGIYVYDRYRRPHRWDDRQRRYWQGRRDRIGVRSHVGDNWRDFRSERRTMQSGQAPRTLPQERQISRREIIRERREVRRDNEVPQ